MDQPLVSIIIPVYNAMPFLKECLESVLAQTYGNYEILCVDDGSTDDSPAVLAAAAEKDARFRILRQENSGAGTARNRGIEEAQGEYLLFADADDRLMPDLLEKAVQKGEESGADAVLFRHFEINAATGEKTIAKEGIEEYLDSGVSVFNREEYADRLFIMVSNRPWNRLVRRSLVMEEGLRYQNLKTRNDFYFSIMCLATAKKLAYVREPLYCYRSMHGSVTFSYKNELCLCGLEASAAVKEGLTKRNLMELLGKTWRVITVRLLGAHLIRAQLTWTVRTEMLRKLREAAEADPELLGMEREAYNPCFRHFDALYGGVYDGLPFAEKQQGRLAPADWADAAENTFEAVYRSFLEYRTAFLEMELHDGTMKQPWLDQAENALGTARAGYALLSVPERNKRWGLPDETFPMFMHLVDEYAALDETGKEKQKRIEEYRRRTEDLKNKNEEKKQEISRLKQEISQLRQEAEENKKGKRWWR